MSHATPPQPAYPVVFDREGRQLFGWYHPPAVTEGGTRDCVVVMSNPIGYDAVCTHRHYRVLAGQLAEAGFAVLRYDHHGTGDSSGSDEDPKRIQAWTNGVARAVEFAKRISGAAHVSLFGVRFGATLALTAASAAPLADTVGTIVTWAPFLSGSLYLREMRALRMMREADVSKPDLLIDVGADFGEESAGYLLAASTIAALGDLNLLDLRKAPAPAALLLARDDIPENHRLARHLAKIGCAVTESDAKGYAAMMRDTFDSVVPLAALAEIGSWLAARYSMQPCRVAAGPGIAIPDRFVAGSSGANAGVYESAVRFGSDDNLFGIVSQSSQLQSERGNIGIIFVSVGSNLHIGPNRMYVTQARVVAALGFVALRMDIGGVGESAPAAGQRENHLYATHSVADVLSAIQFLKARHGIERVVLVGVCSGAYLSFHASVMSTDIASIVLINPQTFTWREGDSLELKIRHGIRSMSFYRSRMFNASTWKRIVMGEVHVGIISKGVVATLRKRLVMRAAGAAAMFKKPSLPDSNARRADIKGAFRKLLARGVNVFMIYSANDGGLNEIETHLGQNASALRKHEQFKFQLVEGADHTFTPLWAQRRLADLLAQHLMRLYG